MESLSLGGDGSSSVVCAEDVPFESTYPQLQLLPNCLQGRGAITEDKHTKCSCSVHDSEPMALHFRAKLPDDTVDALGRVLRVSFPAFLEDIGLG